MPIMKLLIIGHSYVRDLYKLGLDDITIGKAKVEIKYLYKAGGNYSSILDKTCILDQAEEFEPDFVLVILAGNSITCNKSNRNIYENIREFYATLTARIPNAIVISALVELRFYSENNKWGCPTLQEYRKRRHSVNRFLNRLKFNKFILNVCGPGRLDNRKYYRKDGVHLNYSGLVLYFDLIKSTIRYILNKEKFA